MGQYWQLFCLDRGEMCYIQPGFKLGEFFFRKDPACDLQELLTRPSDSVYIIENIERELLQLAKTNQVNSESLRTNQSHTLENIPNEIIDAIFGYIDNLDDAIFFALTCRRFWEIGKHHAVRLRDSVIDAITWVGTRVICGGDYQHDDDWPSSIPKEEHKSYCGKDWADRSGSTSLRHLYPRSRDIIRNLSMSEIRIHELFYKEPYDRKSFVLRNLSKKLYVREEGFDQLFMECRDKRPERVTLGHVAIAQICWSSDPSTSMRYTGPIHRGDWAGDRLEIASKSWHDRNIEETQVAKSNHEGVPDTKNATEQSPSPGHALAGSEGGWKDVTEECMKLIEDIWEADFGDDWRKDALKRSPYDGSGWSRGRW